MARRGKVNEPGERVSAAGRPARYWRRLPLWVQDAAIGAGLAGAALIALLLRTDLKTRGTAAFADPGWDRHLYIEMARRDPGDFRLAPYCWRLLVPWLAKASPFELQPSFLAIALASLLGAGVALFLLIRALGFGRMHAGIAVLLFFSLGWGPKFVVSDFWVPDGTVFLFVVAAMLLAVRDQPKAFALVLAVGVLAKESVLFVGPLLYTLHARTWLDWGRARTTAFAVLPAVAVVIAVRLIISAANGDGAYIATMPPEISRFPDLFPGYNYPDLFRTVAREQRWAHRAWRDLDRYFTDAFGALLLLLAAAGAVRRPGLALRLAPFILLVYSQLLFATDTQRLIVLAAPALIWLAVAGVDASSAQLRVRPAAFVLPVILAFLPTLAARDAYGHTLWMDVAVAAGGLGLIWALGRSGSPLVSRKTSIPQGKR